MMCANHYDSYQFVKPPKAASAETRLDFGSVRIQRRSPNGYKHHPAPEWANNTKLLREVVLTYLERRYFIRTPKETDAERLADIRSAAQDRWLPLKFLLQKRLNEYAVASEKERPKIAQRIQETDSEIMIIERRVDILVLSIVYRSYRLNQTSADIGNDLQLTPVMVRQTIHRLHNAYESLTGHRRPTKYAPGGERFGARLVTPEMFKKIFALRAIGLTWPQVYKALGLPNVPAASGKNHGHDRYARSYREYFGRPRMRTTRSNTKVKMERTEDGIKVLYQYAGPQ